MFRNSCCGSRQNMQMPMFNQGYGYNQAMMEQQIIVMYLYK